MRFISITRICVVICALIDFGLGSGPGPAEPNTLALGSGEYSEAQMKLLNDYDPHGRMLNQPSSSWLRRFFIGTILISAYADDVPLNTRTETKEQLDDARIVYHFLTKRITMWCLRTHRRRDCRPLRRFVVGNPVRLAMFIRFGLAERSVKEANVLLTNIDPVEPAAVAEPPLTAGELAFIRTGSLIDVTSGVVPLFDEIGISHPIREAIDRLLE